MEISPNSGSISHCIGFAIQNSCHAGIDRHSRVVEHGAAVVPSASTFIASCELAFNKSRVPKLRFSLKIELKSNNIATQQIKQRDSDGVDAQAQATLSPTG
jgi:hypothetical protein